MLSFAMDTESLNGKKAPLTLFPPSTPFHPIVTLIKKIL